jgi:hypothetical protein
MKMRKENDKNKSPKSIQKEKSKSEARKLGNNCSTDEATPAQKKHSALTAPTMDTAPTTG